MEKRVGIVLVCAAISALAISTTSKAQNLIVDPSFTLETTAPNPNPGDVPGWSLFGGASIVTAASVGVTPSAGAGPNVLETPAGGGDYSVPGTYQVFAVSPGQTYTFSGNVYCPITLPALDNDFALLQLAYYTGSGPNNYGGGTEISTSSSSNYGEPAAGGGIPLVAGVWSAVSVTGTVPNGANSMGAYILDINADSNGTFYWDPFSLVVVPEPSTFTMALVALLGLAGFVRKRRV